MTKQKIQQFLRSKGITTVKQLKDIFNSAEKRTDLYASLEESEYSIFTYLCSVSDFTVFFVSAFAIPPVCMNFDPCTYNKIHHLPCWQTDYIVSPNTVVVPATETVNKWWSGDYAKIPDMRLPIWEQTQTTGGNYIYIAGYDPFKPENLNVTTPSRDAYLRLQEKRYELCTHGHPSANLTDVLKFISAETEEEFDKIMQEIKEREIFKQFDVTQEDIKRAMSEAAENLKEDYSEGDLNLEKVIGQKFNKNKPKLSLLFKQFPKALEAIVKCSEYGHNKYKDSDSDFLNFKRVEGGSQTYADAGLRHRSKNDLDSESSLPHQYHTAWNALAELELWIEENNS